MMQMKMFVLYLCITVAYFGIICVYMCGLFCLFFSQAFFFVCEEPLYTILVYLDQLFQLISFVYFVLSIYFCIFNLSYLYVVVFECCYFTNSY